MTAGTLVTIEVMVLFFGTPFLYFFHQRKHMAYLAVAQYVLSALFTFSLLIYPTNDVYLWYVFFTTVFHLCLAVSTVLVLTVTFHVFINCIIDIFGKKLR